MPGIIRTRWAHLFAVIGFIPDLHDDARTPLQVGGDLMIPKEFAQVHL
jgi:hypothetical protein